MDCMILIPGSDLPYPYTHQTTTRTVVCTMLTATALSKPFDKPSVHVVRRGNEWALTTESSRVAGEPPVATWRQVDRMMTLGSGRMVRAGQFLVAYRPMGIVDAVYDSLDDVLRSLASTLLLKLV